MSSFFGASRSRRLTLQQARSLLNLSVRQKNPGKKGESVVEEETLSLSREEIQSAFRHAAKLHHPDLTSTKCTEKFRSIQEAREILMDHYIHKKKLHPEVYDDYWKDEGAQSSFSNREFQIEILMRYGFFALIAMASVYRDYSRPYVREQQLRQRELAWMTPGPLPPRL